MADPKKRAGRWKAKYDLKRVNETLNDLRKGTVVLTKDRAITESGLVDAVW